MSAKINKALMAHSKWSQRGMLLIGLACIFFAPEIATLLVGSPVGWKDILSYSEPALILVIFAAVAAVIML